MAQSCALWFELLQNTNAADLSKSKNRPVIEIEASTKIADALKILAANDILSAPIREGSQILGFVDVLDIAGYLLSQYKKQMSLWRIESRPTTDEFMNREVKVIINYSQWNDSVIVLEHSPLRQVMESLVSPSRHFSPHRVAVIDTNNILVGILSQSDMISFLNKNIQAIPFEARNKTVDALKIAHRPIMVRLDDPFFDALITLYNARVGGIALVDQEARLCGNLSASDLRGIQPTAFAFFTGSTIQFLVKGTQTTLRAPITCLASTTFEQLVNILATEHVHRVYVTTDYGYPLGVITLTDILRILI